MRSSEADRVKDVALRLVDAVVPRLEARKVLPVSEYHPFVRVGTDYFGDDVRGLTEHDEFEAVLTEVYEQRFSSDRPLGQREFPSKFLYSFLEAVITACVRSSRRAPRVMNLSLEARPQPKHASTSCWLRLRRTRWSAAHVGTSFT